MLLEEQLPGGESFIISTDKQNISSTAYQFCRTASGEDDEKCPFGKVQNRKNVFKSFQKNDDELTHFSTEEYIIYQQISDDRYDPNFQFKHFSEFYSESIQPRKMHIKKNDRQLKISIKIL